MSKVIDLSGFKKDDITIKSLIGNEYTIPGNFASEFFIQIYKTKKEVDKIKKDDYEKSFNVLKKWTLELLTLDKSNKDITMQTIEEEFNDFQVLDKLLTSIMEFATSEN